MFSLTGVTLGLIAIHHVDALTQGYIYSYPWHSDTMGTQLLYDGGWGEEVGGLCFIILNRANFDFMTWFIITVLPKIECTLVLLLLYEQALQLSTL